MGRNKSRLPSLQQVADSIGVSKATVSYVLNKKKCVSPETVKLVEDAIRKHGYYEVHKARSKKQNNVIGIIVPDNSESFFRKIVQEITNKLNEYNKILNTDFGTILCISNDVHSEEVKLAKLLKKLNVTGLIIAPTYYDQNYLINIFGENFPVIFIDREPEVYSGEKIVVKTMNNYEITKNCINYLIELGHKKIGFVYGHSNINTAKQRRKAYEQALRENNIVFDASFIKEIESVKNVSTADRVRAGYDLIKTLVETKKVTALFCAHNFGTLSAIKYTINNNRRIPDDISIIGFDDNEWTESLEISTIRQAVEEIGRLAARELIKRIHPLLSLEDGNTEPKVYAQFIKRKSVSPKGYPILISSNDGYVRDEKGNICGIWDKNRVGNKQY